MGSQDIEILLRLSKGHLKLVPPEEFLGLTNPNKLRPTDWPLDLVVVANAGGRSKWLSAAALQEALVPAARAVCQVPDQHVELFPPDVYKHALAPGPSGTTHMPAPSRAAPYDPPGGRSLPWPPCDTGLPPLELWPLQPDLRGRTLPPPTPLCILWRYAAAWRQGCMLPCGRATQWPHTHGLISTLTH